MKKKIQLLIAGGTGFIGFHLAKKAISKGWNVTSLSTKKPKRLRRLKKVKYLICDLSKKKKLKTILKNKYSYVVNLSGYVDHSNKIKTTQSHNYGCKNLSNLLLEHMPISFVQMGSSLEYGMLNRKTNEKSNCRPQSTYGIAKFKATTHLLNLYDKYNFPVTVLRLFQTYGPYQELNRVIPISINNCLNGRTFNCSDGKQYRDFIFIDDLINVIFKSFSNSKSRGQIFNIGSGKATKIRDVINLIKKFVGDGNPLFGKIKLRKEESKFSVANLRKTKKYLKWQPKISLKKGIKLTINSYK